jgi:RimJ/RimL family protein N-acetyltransferase
MNLINLEILNERNIPELQELLIKCSDFLTFQDGEPVKKDAANDLLMSKPETVSNSDKIVFGVYESQDHSLVGVIDIIMNYAGPTTISLGLLVIEPQSRGKGIGEKAHELVEDWACRNNFSRIRLGVLFGNDKGLRFWHRVGYKETGEVKPYLFHKFRVLEKQIIK